MSVGMATCMDFLQGFDTDVSVDLGGIEPCVSEHSLDMTNVRATVEHMGGAAMAEEVGGSGFAHSGLFHDAADPVP